MTKENSKGKEKYVLELGEKRLWNFKMLHLILCTLFGCESLQKISLTGVSKKRQKSID